MSLLPSCGMFARQPTSYCECPFSRRILYDQALSRNARGIGWQKNLSYFLSVGLDFVPPGQGQAGDAMYDGPAIF